MLGVDAVEIARIRELADADSGEKFLQRVFTAGELAYCKPKGKCKYDSLAARFAVKEAVGKALGVGVLTELDLTDIEVVNDHKGKPEVVLRGRALALAGEKNIAGFEISLTHTSAMSIAVALARKG